MAGIGDLQKNYLELLVKDYPEYKAGLMSAEPNLEFEQVYNPPRGPLYDVQPTYDEQGLEVQDSWFEEGEPVQIPGERPRPIGPLHNIDMDRTADIYADRPFHEFANMRKNFEIYDDNSMSQFSGPTDTTSYAEWQPKANEEFSMDKVPLSNIELRDYPKKHLWGSHNPITGEIGLNKDLMDLFGTRPTSPRNEEFIDASAVGLPRKTRPVQLNKFVADVLGHEYRHGTLDKPGFADIKKDVMGTNINELFGNNPANPHQDLDPDLSDYDKEELFNELLDLANMQKMTGRMTGILAGKNTNYMNWKLKNFMKNKPKWGSAEMDYVNLMMPHANRYFEEVDRQNRVFQPTGGGGGGWSPSGADLSPGGGYGQSPTGSDIAGTPFSRGGILGAF